ncbi:MAG: pilus assembly PilX N-terminal domain-containing protein [bacterium]|nr:pilus assembly PilX N-terminal domain-containing protein [bacterium]
MNKCNTNKSVVHNQQGLIAIFSVLMIMGILTLLTIGFTNITRLAQRRALDDALNTQAFYAAETGINSAMRAIVDIPLTSEVTDCNDLSSDIDYEIDASRGIEITCLLVNPTPTNLEFETVPEAGLGEPIVSQITSVSGTVIDNLFFEWDSVNPSDPIGNSAPISVPLGSSATSAQSPRLLSEAAWGANVGMVRVDLVPTSVSENDRSALVDNGYTFFLYPTSSGSTLNIPVLPGANNQGGTLFTRCDAAATGDYRCGGNINVVGPGVSNSYYIRMYSYYNPVKLRVTALSGSTEEELRDGQAVIDATGQANDVYRRIQVRAPLLFRQTGLHDVFAVFSGESICKRYIGIPSNTYVSRPTGASSDPSCNIQ